jgi:hypothetical protein
MTTWTVYARDASLRRQGEVDDFADLEAVRRWNDVGTWTITVDRRSPLADVLRQPGAGILITRDDAVWMGGSWDKEQHSVEGGKEVLTLSGKDDNVWLKRRLASPCPAEMLPPYTTQAYDVRTGVCSTILRQYVDVNLGPGSVSTRRHPLVTIGSDPAVGSTVTGRARWQLLLPLLQELATNGGIGFALAQVGTTWQFQTMAAVDSTAAVKFSRELGNLAEFSYEGTAPEANYAFVGGGGEGTARTIYEKPDSASIAAWGRIEGELVDRRDTTVTAELAQAATEAQTDRGAKSILSATLVDTTQIAYGRDYDIGTKVTIELDNPGSTDVVRDLVRRVTLKGDEDGFTITPAVGPEGTQDAGLQVYRTIRELRGRVIDLERI